MHSVVSVLSQCIWRWLSFDTTLCRHLLAFHQIEYAWGRSFRIVVRIKLPILDLSARLYCVRSLTVWPHSVTAGQGWRMHYTYNQPTRHVVPMLLYCWASVKDDGPIIKQHWGDVLCFLEYIYNPPQYTVNTNGLFKICYFQKGIGNRKGYFRKTIEIFGKVKSQKLDTMLSMYSIYYLLLESESDWCYILTLNHQKHLVSKRL